MHNKHRVTAPGMSVLLLDLCSLIFAGRCSGLSTSSPLSTSPDVMDACDRLPWEECVLPTDLLLNTNLGKSDQKTACDELTGKRDIIGQKIRITHHFSRRSWLLICFTHTHILICESTVLLRLSALCYIYC